MKKHIKIIVLALSTALITGCSAWPDQKPAPESEPAMVKEPDPAVTASDAASAIMAAEEAVSNANQRGDIWRDTDKLIERANDAMDKNEYKMARDLANRAQEQAEYALAQSYRGDALSIIGILRTNYMSQMSLEQKSNLSLADAALDSGQEKEAYEIATGTMDEVKAQMAAEKAAMEKMAEPEPEMTNYTVNRNDTLWDIAAKPEVYGNSDMWPLLWKANKDKIKKPDDLASGLSLIIDLSASEESVAAAIKHSKLRGATSLGPVDAFDQQYLSE
jgi:nucleoid-associated protein YgaU